MRHQPTAFPVGLYGMLLFALCWLTLPTVFAPLERWLVGAACLLPRAIAVCLPNAVHAASGDSAAPNWRALADDLHARQEANDTAAGRPLVPSRLQPIACAVRLVVDDRSKRGGGGRPAELRLARSHAELQDCAPFVTKGEALLGFLQRAGAGVAVDDRPTDDARVVLLNHRTARPVGAVLEQPDGGRLRLVVRGAAVIDQAPLTADLWDDPYRAARLDRSGQIVRTYGAGGDAEVPAGLLLGHTRIWGYDGAGTDESLTIGVFVVPPFDAAALSQVVVWQNVNTPPLQHERRPRVRTVPAEVRDLPGAVHGRQLLVANGVVPDGAAVVQDGRLLGTARGLAFGAGLVTSFATSRHRWSLVLLPTDAQLAPIEIDGEIETTRDDVVWFRWRTTAFDGGHPQLPAGHVFTGCNGPSCPSGLAVGTVEPHPERRDLLVITTPPAVAASSVEVLVAEESR